MLKSFLKKFIPPVLLDVYKALKKPQKSFTGPVPYEEIPNENVWFDNTYKKHIRSKVKSIDLSKKYKYDYLDILTLYLNSIIENGRSMKVFDWAGGTGRVWFNIYENIYKPEMVEWNVVDKKFLMEMGESHSKQNNIPIRFFENMDNLPFANYDVIYINSSIQYLKNFQKLLTKLLKKKPRHIIFNRLLISEGNMNLTFRQKIGERVTPCTFISEKVLIDFLFENGFKPIFNSPCWGQYIYLNSILPKKSKKILGKYFSKDIIFRKI